MLPRVWSFQCKQTELEVLRVFWETFIRPKVVFAFAHLWRVSDFTAPGTLLLKEKRAYNLCAKFRAAFGEMRFVFASRTTAIVAEFAKRLFLRFFRLRHSRSRDLLFWCFVGLGLGLLLLWNTETDTLAKGVITVAETFVIWKS